MNSYTFDRRLVWIILSFVLVLVACSTSGETLPAQSGTQVFLSRTPTFPNSTLTITPLSTVTPSPVWTSLPTLPSNEAKALVLDLLQDNGGCRLPCWWGITPGITTWYDAERFLGRFVEHIGMEDQGEEHQVAYVRIPSPIDVPYITYLEQTYGIQGGVVETISTYNFELADWYYLPNILNAYGQPDEVGIYTFRNAFNGSQPTGILLFYLDQGVLIEYVGQKKVETTQDMVQICPGGTYNFLYLWSPAVRMTYDNAVRTFLDIQNMPYPLPLEKATGMDVTTFYKTFKNPNATTCLETPTELWPIY